MQDSSATDPSPPPPRSAAQTASSPPPPLASPPPPSPSPPHASPPPPQAPTQSPPPPRSPPSPVPPPSPPHAPPPATSAQSTATPPETTPPATQPSHAAPLRQPQPGSLCAQMLSFVQSINVSHTIPRRNRLAPHPQQIPSALHHHPPLPPSPSSHQFGEYSRMFAVNGSSCIMMKSFGCRFSGFDDARRNSSSCTKVINHCCAPLLSRLVSPSGPIMNDT